MVYLTLLLTILSYCRCFFQNISGSGLPEKLQKSFMSWLRFALWISLLKLRRTGRSTKDRMLLINKKMTGVINKNMVHTTIGAKYLLNIRSQAHEPTDLNGSVNAFKDFYSD